MSLDQGFDYTAPPGAGQMATGGRAQHPVFQATLLRASIVPERNAPSWARIQHEFQRQAFRKEAGMRNGLLVAIAIAGFSLSSIAAAQQGAEIAGAWSGPWYRGMTSGIVTIELDDAGSGTIRFTNLENFGEDTVALKNVERDGKKISFSAAGKSGVEFTASATVSSDGGKLRGNGRYEGFGVRFEARPQKN